MAGLKSPHYVRNKWHDEGVKFRVGDIARRDQQEILRATPEEVRVDKVGILGDDSTVVLLGNGQDFVVGRSVTGRKVERVQAS